MPKPLRKLLHTSDVHLDHHFEPGQPTPAQLGLTAVIDEAIAHQVDLVLLTGDLFDHNRVGQPVIDFACSELGRLPCPVVMISGNHDCYTEQSVYHRVDLTDTNIHHLNEVRGEELQLLDINFWGRGIIDHHPGHRPLAETPRPINGDWHVGLAHGYFDQRGGTAFSSLISAEEIAATGFDYLALGHVHVYADVSQGQTRAAYSGSPSSSTGASTGSYVLVTLDPQEGVSLEPRLVES